MDVHGSLIIRDASGEPRIILDASGEHPSIIMTSPSGANMVIEFDQRVGRLTFRRTDGTDSVAVISSDGGVVVALCDRESKTRRRLVFDADTCQLTLKALSSAADDERTTTF
jgi:anti-sigma-K factor RskA